MIWTKPATKEQMNQLCKDTLVSHIDIEITEVGADFLIGTIPVSEKTKQPLGLLHGGANCVIAETLGSVASNYVCDNDHYAVGLNIQTSHLRSETKGIISAIAKPVHLGRTTHIWNIDTTNENGTLTSTTRLTMMILKK